jgi:dTMP kinase
MTFVVIEGPDGAGKSRLQGVLADACRRRGLDVVTLREPGSTPLGERLRAILLDPAVGHVDALTEALLFSAARSEMVREVIRPARASGRVILLDRWFWSTLAYQGGGGGASREVIERVSAAVTEGAEPDLVLLLDVAPEVGAARKGRPDRMENRDRAYFDRVRAVYRELAARAGSRCVVLDSARPFEAVCADARAAVDRVLPR